MVKIEYNYGAKMDYRINYRQNLYNDLNTIIYLIYKNECLVCILRAVVPHPFDCDKTLSTHCYRHSRKAIVKKKYFLNNFFFFNFKLTIRNAKFRFKKKTRIIELVFTGYSFSVR